jgi:hypothetical protein
MWSIVTNSSSLTKTLLSKIGKSSVGGGYSAILLFITIYTNIFLNIKFNRKKNYYKNYGYKII